MRRKRKLKGVKAIANHCNISVRAFWYWHKVKPFPIFRIMPGGGIWAYATDIDKYLKILERKNGVKKIK